MEKQLDVFRKQIDIIDNKIIELVAKRLTVVKQIGKLKKQKKLPILDKSRWQFVLSSKIAKGELLGLKPNLIKTIYESIHAESLEIENNI